MSAATATATNDANVSAANTNIWTNVVGSLMDHPMILKDMYLFDENTHAQI